MHSKRRNPLEKPGLFNFVFSLGSNNIFHKHFRSMLNISSDILPSLEGAQRLRIRPRFFRPSFNIPMSGTSFVEVFFINLITSQHTSPSLQSKRASRPELGAPAPYNFCAYYLSLTGVFRFRRRFRLLASYFAGHCHSWSCSHTYILIPNVAMLFADSFPKCAVSGLYGSIFTYCH